MLEDRRLGAAVLGSVVVVCVRGGVAAWLCRPGAGVLPVRLVVLLLLSVDVRRVVLTVRPVVLRALWCSADGAAGGVVAFVHLWCFSVRLSGGIGARGALMLLWRHCAVHV